MSILSENISTQYTDNKFIQEVKMAKPVDFSFRSIKTLNSKNPLCHDQSNIESSHIFYFILELKNDIPRIYRLHGAPERGVNKKLKSAAIWLNHNNLSDLNNLKKFVNDQLESPMYLTWLDVSHNELKYIDQVRARRNKHNSLYFFFFLSEKKSFPFNFIYIVIK